MVYPFLSYQIDEHEKKDSCDIWTTPDEDTRQ